jgi:hypothetical protein
MCSSQCNALYKCQWTQFGLIVDERKTIHHNDRLLKFYSNELKRNEKGEVCLMAWDLEVEEDEYNHAPVILIPLSAAASITQVLR